MKVLQLLDLIPADKVGRYWLIWIKIPRMYYLREGEYYYILLPSNGYLPRAFPSVVILLRDSRQPILHPNLALPQLPRCMIHPLITYMLSP